MAPFGVVAKSLFLGDYVDRGDHSVECILYLLIAKVLMPEKVHLLRGNHEMRQVQAVFTTLKECRDKFDGEVGDRLWESLNQVFDCMPFAALIDEHIFAAHGGIPASGHLETLLTVPKPLKNPIECGNSSAWEALWNDPTPEEETGFPYNLPGTATLFPKYPAGFSHNTKRSTALFYSQEALDLFLARNGLTALIRAHEVKEKGFHFQMDGRMITVFRYLFYFSSTSFTKTVCFYSCSHYLGSTNKSAVIYVDENGKMRPIQIETDYQFA